MWEVRCVSSPRNMALLSMEMMCAERQARRLPRLQSICDASPTGDPEGARP